MRLIRLFFRKLAEQLNCRLQNRTANLLKDQTSYTFPSWSSKRTSRKRRRAAFFSVARPAANDRMKHSIWMSFMPTLQDLNKQTTLRVAWSGWFTQIAYLGGVFFVHPDAWGDDLIWLYDMFQLVAQPPTRYDFWSVSESKWFCVSNFAAFSSSTVVVHYTF